MTRLHDLFSEQGQSPWLDNLKRGYLTGGDLTRYIESGVRGITSNPTIFQKAISGGSDYDDAFRALIERHETIQEAYWDLVVDDIHEALHRLAPLYEESAGGDGFVSVELDPNLARHTEGSIAAARELRGRLPHPNVLVKIPATAEGVPAIRRMIAERCSINVTLIFSLPRYDEVIEAYLSGLEEAEGDLSGVHSVASFFVGRVDAEIDARLDKIGSDEALALRGRAALAQAKLAYALFRRRFSGDRWDALVARGARLQRPLWASTSTKNPEYPDTLYVDNLIGPDTVNTLPDATIDAFEDHGTVARTVDTHLDEAEAVIAELGTVGVDLADVSRTLEDQGVASFAASFDDLLGELEKKAAALGTETAE